MVYCTTDKSDNEYGAEWYLNLYAQREAKRKARKGEISKEEIGEETRKIAKERGQIIEFDVNKEDTSQYFEIFESHGAVPFIFQEQLYEMSKNKSARWLVQSDYVTEQCGKSEAIDISNFADFVDWRDSRVIGCLENNGLQLPNGEQSYDEYIQYLEKAKEKEKETIEIAKNVVTSFAKENDVVQEKESAKEAISIIEQQLSKENKNVENEK